MLAAEVLRVQGIHVLALFFETPFFGPERAEASARLMDLPFEVVNITERHLEVVRHPKTGYGSAMNPCVDCHALMFRIAGELVEAREAAFVATGEVLGQRPLSQNKGAMNRIARESGLQGRLLRPLSAKLLSPTLPEEKGWVQREALFDFRGRTRKPQMELANRLRISGYPSPAGGCLLTEQGFSRRLKDLLTSRSEIETRELELLKLGRHFRIGPNTKLVVGRNKRENDLVQGLAGTGGILLKSVSVPGPTVLLCGDPSGDTLHIAAAITATYSDTAGQEATDISVRQRGGDIQVLSAPVRLKSEFKGLMI